MLTRNFSKNRPVLILVFLGVLLSFGGPACGAEPAANNVIPIQIYTNKSETSYTEYRFAVSKDGRKIDQADWETGAWANIKIQWDVVDRAGNPKPLKYIRVHQTPEAGSFSTNAAIHKAMLREIFSRWPVSDFDSIEFIGPLDAAPDWSWSLPIAVASSKSDDYTDYKAHYPHSKVTGLFGLYRQWVDDTKVSHPIQEVFREFGADIGFMGGEKEVLHSKAQDLPFYPQLRVLGIDGKTRVVYNAIGNAFTIKPWHTNAPPPRPL